MRQHGLYGATSAFGGALRGSFFPPSPSWGAENDQPLQGLPEQSQMAAASAAIKAIARLAADVWRSMAGTDYFIARGSLQRRGGAHPPIFWASYILNEKVDHNRVDTLSPYCCAAVNNMLRRQPRSHWGGGNSPSLCVCAPASPPV